MTTLTYLETATPELTDSQIREILGGLDIQLNRTMLAALLYGMYTGVVAVTLGAVASRDKSQNSRRPRFLVFVILLLYFLTAFNIYGHWAAEIFTFITYGKIFWPTNISDSDSPGPVKILLIVGIGAMLSTVFADAALIWRCWIVWGRSWRVVIIPIACSTLATVSRGIITYYSTLGPSVPPRALFLENVVSWTALYSSLILATLLWCTIFIIYRILRVGGAAGRIRVYQRVIEMLVESASLYSVMIVVLLVFQVRNEVTGGYVEELAIAMRGIMPTILVGRVAAGHARPDDSWNESTARSSLRFGNHSGSHVDTQTVSDGSQWDTSSPLIPDLEEGLEDITEVRAEGAAPTVSAYDCSARIAGRSDSSGV